MNDFSMTASIPLDDDGFLRRECPNCEREFKWLPTSTEEEPEQDVEPTTEPPKTYFCPYCGQPAEPNAWHTKAQVEYAGQLVTSEYLGPQLRELQDQMESINRAGSFIRIETELTGIDYPEKLVEANDLVRVNLPCHPEEPLKVDEDWNGDVHCLVCGIHYPVDLVRVLE